MTSTILSKEALSTAAILSLDGIRNHKRCHSKLVCPLKPKGRLKTKFQVFRRPSNIAVANRLLGLPRVFQRDRAIEHGLLGAVVFAVGHEIAQSLKLPTALSR